MPNPIAVAATAALAAATPAGVLSINDTTAYHSVTIENVNIFYREAGPKDAPTIVLLHGYPSSSQMWAPLIPLLADRYHVIAPDYPGFGLSAAPTPAQYRYTFDHLAKTTEALLDWLKVQKYTLFVQDYGGPVGFRMMLDRPEKLQALIVQNANAYEEGLGPKWKGIAQYWRNPADHSDQLDAFMSYEGAKKRHIGTSPHPDRYNPESWQSEFAHLSQVGQRDIQGQLLLDYQNNIAAYPIWQAWLKRHRPPTLVLWGRYDQSFIEPGAEAYRRDLPDAEIHILDAGHFGLDESTDDIARLTRKFLARVKLTGHREQD